MNIYKKWVMCKKIIQEEVSIYETCERDIGAPGIHRFPRVDGGQREPRDRGVTIPFSTENRLIELQLS